MTAPADSTSRPPAGGVRSRAVLVLGMHRSGTSAIAGALGHAGVVLGDRLIAAAADNPSGYFENADAVLANERLLDALDRSWDDVRPMPAGWLQGAPAAEAARAVGRDVVEPLRGHATWGLKDPRMCRVLPLWLRALQADGVDASGVLVLRHPDEVAESLARRDGMHRRAAHLLWLRHTLEAAAGAPHDAVAVRYDRFVGAPVDSIRAIADALRLPLRPAASELEAFVDPAARHHVAGVVQPADPWHALALDAFEALGQPAWRDALPGLASRLQALDEAGSAWIEALGRAARGADVRRRASTEQALQAERRAETLQAALDHANAVAARQGDDTAALAAALARAEALVEARTSQATELDSRLAEALGALARAEQLASERAEEAATLDGRLVEASRALARAEQLASERAKEAAMLDGRLLEASRALARAEQLASERADEAAALDRRLGQAQAALAAAEAIVLERAAEVSALDRRLADTAAALAEVEGLAQARGREAAGLDARLVETSAALSRAEAIAQQARDEAATLAVQTRRTAEALSAAEALVARQNVEIAELVAENGRLHRAKAEAERIAAARLSDMAALAEAKAHAEAIVLERTAEAGSLLAQLGATEAAQAAAEALAIERLAQLEATAAELDSTRAAMAREQAHAQARLDEARDALAQATARGDALQARLARIRASRLWPAFSRAARLGRDDDV